jgi:hypothetical protein
MSEKTPLEWLIEVKEALDFQMIMMTATGTNSIRLNKDHAYICHMAIEKMISKYQECEDKE